MTSGAADWAALYRDNVAAVTALAGDLDDERLDRFVPATPAWTVHDVYAHLAGGPADLMTGRMDGAPGPEWTARHVGERHGLALSDLLSEIGAHADPVGAAATDQPVLAWDIAVHHADLCEALDTGPVDPALWTTVLDAVAPVRLADLPVTVVAGDRRYGAGGDQVEVAPYELFRTLFSRRSRAQIRAWAGPAPTDEHLDGLGVFGPRPD